MTSSSTNSTKTGKVVGFNLDNINRKRVGWHRFVFWGVLEKGVTLFSGGLLQTQGETVSLSHKYSTDRYTIN